MFLLQSGGRNPANKREFNQIQILKQKPSPTEMIKSSSRNRLPISFVLISTTRTTNALSLSAAKSEVQLTWITNSDSHQGGLVVPHTRPSSSVTVSGGNRCHIRTGSCTNCLSTCDPCFQTKENCPSSSKQLTAIPKVQQERGNGRKFCGQFLVFWEHKNKTPLCSQVFTSESTQTATRSSGTVTISTGRTLRLTTVPTGHLCQLCCSGLVRAGSLRNTTLLVQAKSSLSALWGLGNSRRTLRVAPHTSPRVNSAVRWCKTWKKITKRPFKRTEGGVLFLCLKPGLA